MQKITNIYLFFYSHILIVTNGSHLNSRNEEKLLKSKKLSRVLKLSIIFQHSSRITVSRLILTMFPKDIRSIIRQTKILSKGWENLYKYIKFELDIIFHGYMGIFIYDNKQRWLWDGIFWGLGMGIFHFGLDLKITGDSYR